MEKSKGKSLSVPAYFCLGKVENNSLCSLLELFSLPLFVRVGYRILEMKSYHCHRDLLILSYWVCVCVCSNCRISVRFYPPRPVLTVEGENFSPPRFLFHVLLKVDADSDQLYLIYSNQRALGFHLPVFIHEKETKKNSYIKMCA